jgi:hypothetical protein
MLRVHCGVGYTERMSETAMFTAAFVASIVLFVLSSWMGVLAGQDLLIRQEPAERHVRRERAWMLMAQALKFWAIALACSAIGTGLAIAPADGSTGPALAAYSRGFGVVTAFAGIVLLGLGGSRAISAWSELRRSRTASGERP